MADPVVGQIKHSVFTMPQLIDHASVRDYLKQHPEYRLSQDEQLHVDGYMDQLYNPTGNSSTSLHRINIRRQNESPLGSVRNATAAPHQS